METLAKLIEERGGNQISILTLNIVKSYKNLENAEIEKVFIVAPKQIKE